MNTFSMEDFKTCYDAYGADRLYWASDFPASRDMLTYTQAIEVVRTHCDYLPKADLDKIIKLAKEKGWHSFRKQVIDLAEPYDKNAFVKAIGKKKR